MKYKNPYYRKIKSSHRILVSCGHCKTGLVNYQKYGPGGLINMYIDRIIDSDIDLTRLENALICPACGEQLGSRMTLKAEKKEVFRMHRGSFNSKKL